MKSYFNIFFIFLSFFLMLTANLNAGAVISKFEGTDGGNKVILNWQSVVEISLEYYEIERSLDQNQFIKIGKVDASGPNNYTFIDRSVFKLNSHTFYYRIKLVDKDGSSTLYGKVISVKPNVSGIKHTWGSLKAMFR
jgi:hypothetical protein